MKLNYKRTIFVGFAFFLITAFWQAYDTIVPKILTDKFGLAQTWSGAIMALDNIFALFLLPIFGAISDKVNSKYGRRTPFIVIGTVLAAALHDLPIMEYPPTCVKLATVGRGGAGKPQVAFMMRALLHLTETPAPDAADALAIGYTHLAASDPIRAHLFRERKYI